MADTIFKKVYINNDTPSQDRALLLAISEHYLVIEKRLNELEEKLNKMRCDEHKIIPFCRK